MKENLSAKIEETFLALNMTELALLVPSPQQIPIIKIFNNFSTFSVKLSSINFQKFRETSLGHNCCMAPISCFTS